MTPEEKFALNRRVALALGAKAYSSPCVQGHELYGRYYVAFKIQSFIDRNVTDTIEQYQPYTEEMERVRSMPKIPDYCTDPAATETIRLEIERRGGTVRECSEPGLLPNTRRYFADVDLGTSQRSAQSSHGRGFALTEAFVTACGVEQEAKK